jgi:23S rRNA (uracil1939-C5)-methyltransferase
MDLAEQQTQQGTSVPADLASGASDPQPAPALKVAPGDRLHLTLTAWGRLGEAMAEHAGQNVFVFGGIPGEQVVAEVVRIHRKYVSAMVVEVVVPSPSRVEPPCPYYGQCTGCQWQHLDYEAQLSTKQDKVLDALTRVGGFADPEVSAILPSPNEYRYRNHARFTVNRDGVLGFVNRETRRFVRIDDCMLMHQGINDLLQQLQDRCQETTQLSIRAGKYSGDALVQPTLSHPGITVPTGQKRYTESVDGREFFVSSPSFFQVNVEQAAQAAAVVKEQLSLSADDVLLDAYTGVGTFAILLAPAVKKVIAVEESSSAVADARENAAGLENVEFVLGRTELVLNGLAERPNVVVLDPPRAGCQEGALVSLIEMAPPRVAYISCDAETLARDLRILCQGGYILDRVVPIDMFPQTHHVECVAVLRWFGERSNDGNGATVPLVLASASPRRRELMQALGLDFEVLPADVPEDPRPGELPSDLVQRLSRDKAKKIADGMDQGFVIGADSVVVYQGKPVGKPADDDEARTMLRELRGTTHHVCTGLTVIDAESGRSLTDSLTSQVTLREFSDEEIETSIASGTPKDKAGAYAVQDTELRPASHWEGCYNNIVGLPLCRLLEMLSELGCQLPSQADPPNSVMCGPECLSPGFRLEKGGSSVNETAP